MTIQYKLLQILFLLSISTFVFSQQKIIGTVQDNEGTLLPGVNVFIKNSQIGSSTDFDGKFEISANIGQILIFSSLGFDTLEHKIKSPNLNITLSESLDELNEVVVVGYGTQKKSDLTGAVTSIDGSQLTTSPVASTNNSLVGRIPGLVSRQTSGEPGKDAASLNIRGFGQALIIVDGIQRSLNDIDPNSIESISVLKDASAAIFGARAGNGVILVTTKRGKDSKTKINFNTSYGLQGFTDFPRPYNSGQFTELWLEAQKNDGIPESRWTYTPEEVQKYYDGTDPKYPNTDWFDVAVRDWSPQQNNNISIEGGNENVNYYALLGLLDQEGFVYTGDHKFKRYNVIANVDSKISETLKASINFSVINSNLTSPQRSYNSGADNRNVYFQDLFTTRPFYPSSYPDPTKIPFTGGLYNPVANASIDVSGYRKRLISKVNVAGGLEYNFPSISGLSTKIFLNYLQNFERNKTFVKTFTTYTYDYDNDVYTPRSGGQPTTLQQNSIDSGVLTTQFSLNYDNTFNSHNVSALALLEIIDNKSDTFEGSRINFVTNTIDQLFAGGDEGQYVSGFASEFGRVSYVGRINYSYADKYLLQASARYDASPKFSPENRWGFFPSISLGWRISNEKFLKNSSTIENLKLRASVSKSGYDNIGNFQYLSGFELVDGVIFGGSSIPGLRSTGIANPNLFWEKLTTYNVGLNFGLFSNKLYGELDIFNRKRIGILGTRIASSPNTFGAALPVENLNEQTAKGYEIVLGTQGSSGDFSYKVEGNFSRTRTKWDKFDEPDYTDPDDIRIKKKTGNWANRLFGWKTDGLFTSQEEIDNYPLDQDNRGNSSIRPGDIKYVDVSGPDGIPDGRLDWRDQVQIGRSVVPEIYFGFNSSIKYKNFDMDFLLQGAANATIRVSPAIYINQAFGPQIVYNNHWSEDNNDPNARFPRRSFRRANSVKKSDFWTVDGSYLRLKALSLGYTVPTNNLIQSLRISVSGTNLFTISEAAKFGVDPEVTPDGGAGFYYPVQRVFSVNLNLTM